jgi:hypothetical protein
MQRQVKHLVTKEYYTVLMQIGNPELAQEANAKVGWWVLQPLDGNEIVIISPSQLVTEYQEF